MYLGIENSLARSTNGAFSTMGNPVDHDRLLCCTQLSLEIALRAIILQHAEDALAHGAKSTAQEL